MATSTIPNQTALKRVDFQKSNSAISNVERSTVTKFGKVCFVDLTFTTSSDISDSTAELFKGLPHAWHSTQRVYGFNKLAVSKPIILCVTTDGKLLNQWTSGGIPAGQYQASFTYICGD